MNGPWWVVVNPSAGRRGHPLDRRVAEVLDRLGIEHRLEVSGHPDDVARIVADGVAAGARRYVSVGGDGTAHLVLNGLMAHPWETPPVLAILPAGSGSDFIRTFALPRDLEAAARHLVDDRVYRCDVGLLEGGFGRRWFLNVADVGVAAAAVDIAARLPRRLGGVRYGAGFWLTLARFPARPIRLEAGRRHFEGPAINIVAANGQFFGGGMNIAPKALLNDGKFDLQVFTGPRRQAFTVMPRVIRGLHLDHPGVRRFVAGEFTLTVDDGWPVEADGESIGYGSVRGRVVPGALDVKI